MREEVRVKGHNADNFLMMQEVGVEEKEKESAKADTANVLKTVLSCMILLPRKQNMCFLNRVTYISRQMLKMLSGCFPLFTVKRRTEEMLGEALKHRWVRAAGSENSQTLRWQMMLKWRNGFQSKIKLRGLSGKYDTDEGKCRAVKSFTKSFVRGHNWATTNSSDKQKGFVLP